MIATPDTIKCDSRESWLAARNQGIGGSDAPAAIGISPWKGRFALWSEKVGLVEQADLSNVAAVQWGSRLQYAVGSGYAEESGRLVAHEPEFLIRRHPAHRFMLATLDAEQTDLQRGPGLLEIKTAGASHAKEWSDEPPLHYQVQLQHQLAVTGYSWGTLAVLIGGQKLAWFDCEANEKFIARLVEQEAEFWALVENQTPPEADGAESTTRALAKLYPADNGETIVLADDFRLIDEELAELKATLKDMERRKTEIENRIKAAMGEHTAAIVPGGASYTYKLQTAHHAAKEAYESSFRVLRRKG
jgi:putative phage-type endonuclease